MMRGRASGKNPSKSTVQEGIHTVKKEIIEISTPQQTLPNKQQQENTTIHFFLSKKDLGAIPRELQKCMTLEKFFAEALAAWRELEPESSTPGFVSVKFDWRSIPMVVRWRDAEGFKMMLEAIAGASCWQKPDGRCNVEVRSVKRKT